MPAIIACAACQTKLKVPENLTAKALRCPKCKGIVPLAPAKAELPSEPKQQPAQDKPEEEFEVNEAVDEKEEEFEVNEAADDEGENNEGDEEEKSNTDEDPPLAELGFAQGKDPFKIANLPEPARQAIRKAFLKNEKALWAGRPLKELIESKAWLGFVVGGITLVVALFICLITGLVGLTSNDAAVKIVVPIIGFVVAVIFCGVGLLAVIFRKRMGGNVAACYVVSNKRAYIYDGSSAVPRFHAATTCRHSLSAFEQIRWGRRSDFYL